MTQATENSPSDEGRAIGKRSVSHKVQSFCWILGRAFVYVPRGTWPMNLPNRTSPAVIVQLDVLDFSWTCTFAIFDALVDCLHERKINDEAPERDFEVEAWRRKY